LNIKQNKEMVTVNDDFRLKPHSGSGLTLMISALKLVLKFTKRALGFFNICRVQSVKRLALATVARAECWIRVGISSTHLIHVPCYPHKRRRWSNSA
jgi:hypothetical protein